MQARWHASSETRAVVRRGYAENLQERTPQILLVRETALARDQLHSLDAAFYATAGLFYTQTTDISGRCGAEALNKQAREVTRAHLGSLGEILYRKIAIQMLEHPQLQAAEHVVASLR